MATPRSFEGTRQRARGTWIFAGERLRRLLLRPEPAAVAATLALIVIFSSLSPLFLAHETFVSVANVAAELGIVSVGMTLLIIGGHFDLSVGAVLGLTSFFVEALINDYQVAPGVAFVVALVLAGALGTINGLVVVKAHIHSFVVTLGTMLIYRGLLIALTGGFPKTVSIPPGLREWASGAVLPGGYHMSLVWFVLVVAGATVLLLRTQLGNWLQSVGQNPNAARNLGVPVDGVVISMFTLCSLLGGITGVLQVARFQTVDALRGEGFELQAISVTVIGGTLLSGGYGSAIGTMLGAVIFGMVQVGLVLAGAPGYYYTTLTGLILVISVILNTSVTRKVASAAPLAGMRRGKAPDVAAAAPAITDDQPERPPP
jgi:simple sugar transport system permease protein